MRRHSFGIRANLRLFSGFALEVGLLILSLFTARNHLGCIFVVKTAQLTISATVLVIIRIILINVSFPP